MPVGKALYVWGGGWNDSTRKGLSDTMTNWYNKWSANPSGYDYKMCIRDRMEIFRVSEEAETAQKNSNEKVYRESAIRKQIEFLQQQLEDVYKRQV